MLEQLFIVRKDIPCTTQTNSNEIMARFKEKIAVLRNENVASYFDIVSKTNIGGVKYKHRLLLFAAIRMDTKYSQFSKVSGDYFIQEEFYLEYFTSILHGLQCLHSNNTIHGNLTRKNTLCWQLSNKKQQQQQEKNQKGLIVKLSDYGIGTLCQGDLVDYPTFGRLHYISPYLIKAKDRNDNFILIQNDYWAFAILIAETVLKRKLKIPLNNFNSKKSCWREITLQNICNYSCEGFYYEAFIETSSKLASINMELCHLFKAALEGGMKLIQSCTKTKNELLCLPSTFDSEYFQAMQLFQSWKESNKFRFYTQIECKQNVSLIERLPILIFNSCSKQETEDKEAAQEQIKLEDAKIIHIEALHQGDALTNNMTNEQQHQQRQLFLPHWFKQNNMFYDALLETLSTFRRVNPSLTFSSLLQSQQQNDPDDELWDEDRLNQLLNSYPSSRSLLIQFCKRKGIPTIYRSFIWSALLGVYQNDENENVLIKVYNEFCSMEIDESMKRQIEVDVPRCHQYHELLSSATGSKKLQRLLSAWVAANPLLGYWQGLDSVAAPFLTLFFDNEPMAFACLNVFVRGFLSDFFYSSSSAASSPSIYFNKRSNSRNQWQQHLMFNSKNNNGGNNLSNGSSSSDAIQTCLKKFQLLLFFHDPLLGNHLCRKLQFSPTLYAIPWLLTLFTHVSSIQQTYILWDKLLLEYCSVLPILVAISLLRTFREELLNIETFDDCLHFFAEVPYNVIDIECCLPDAMEKCDCTPTSLIESSFNLDSIPLISIEDVLVTMLSAKALILDLRNRDEYFKYHLVGSIDLFPFSLMNETSLTDFIREISHSSSNNESSFYYYFFCHSASSVNTTTTTNNIENVYWKFIEKGFERLAMIQQSMDSIKASSSRLLCCCKPVPIVIQKSAMFVYKCQHLILSVK